MDRGKATKIMLREIGITFRAEPKQKSLEKLESVIEKLLPLGEKAINDYVSLGRQSLRRVKDPRKRGSVDYFVAILAGSNLFDSFLDGRKVEREIQKETGQDKKDHDFTDNITRNGLVYYAVGNIGTATIYYNPDKSRIIVGNFGGVLPEILSLNRWNKKHPDRKINFEDIKPMMREIENAIERHNRIHTG